MSFSNNNVITRTNDQNSELLRQRKAAMFGQRLSNGASMAVYPLGERVNLPIDLIDEHPDNEKIFNMDFIEELAALMDEDGFSGAVEVYQKDDGRYELLAGHRRYRAMKLNGALTIPAIIEPKPTEEERARRLIFSNLHNRILTPLDYARMIEYYIEKVLKPSGFRGDKTKECARVFMKSETHIKRYMALPKMIPELRELTKNSGFPFTALDGARTFSEEEQKILLDKIYEFKRQNPGTEVSELYIKQTINTIRAKKKKEEERTSIPKETSRSHPDASEMAVIEKEFDLVQPKRRGVDLEEDSIEEMPLRRLENSLNSCFIQLNSINLDTYDTSNKTDILTEIHNIQNVLKQIEQYIQ